MILDLLDTPFSLPETLAYVVERDSLAAFREAFRELIERADVSPIRAFRARRKAAYLAEYQAGSIRVRGAAVRGWCRDVARAATAAGSTSHLPARAVAAIDAWVGTSVIVDVPRSRWWSFARAASTLDALGKRSAASIEVLCATLIEFAPAENRAFEDECEADFLAFLADDEPFESLAPAHAAEDVLRVLELLVGPYTPSLGPGPFLPIPDAALYLHDPVWRMAPELADEGLIPAWPLTTVRFLEGHALEVAAEQVRTAEPSNAWHAPFETYYTDQLTDEAWRDLVAAHAARCLGRYRDCLATAAHDHRAVLLLPNDPDNSDWAPRWVVRLPGEFAERPQDPVD